MAGARKLGLDRKSLKVRPQVLLPLVLVLLLGLLSILMVNQRTILYLFYFPIIFSAWFFGKWETVSGGILAVVMVVGYAVLFPQRLMGAVKPVVLWGDLTLWGGVLIVTAYVISTLRTTAKEAMLDLNRSYEGVLAILSKFIQIVDTDTASHSVRVSNWCVRIAKRMQLKGNVVEQCRVAGLLHDVGKAEVSTALLHKAASLSTGEKKDVSQHVDCGAALLHPIGGMLEAIAAAVENHHEKWDGSGYKGLKGEEIPLVARIVAVADAVDAIMSDRPYRKGASSFQAMDIVISSAGSHFDPQVVEAMKMAVRADEEPVAASDSPMADQAMSATGYGL